MKNHRSRQVKSWTTPSIAMLTRTLTFLIMYSSSYIQSIEAFVSPQPRLAPVSETTSTIATTTTAARTTQLLCQLLGMNCATPTDFNFSFRGFASRGGETDIHSHGFGVAFYEGQGLRCFHDSQPAAASPIASFLTKYPIKSLNMMAHIRYATQGTVSLANVHPFQREMWGIQWCFAHNGDVPLFKNGIAHITKFQEEERFHPVGDTDSEALFCSLLNALHAKFETLPSLPVLHDTLSGLCAGIVEKDSEEIIMNFLLTCGPHVQFVYSWPGARPGSKVWNGLYYTVREPPFKAAHLSDVDYAVNFADVTTEKDRVAVIATKPLTDDEIWVEFERGEMIMFDQGLPHLSAEACFSAELRGHGLESKVIPPPKIEEDLKRYHVEADHFAGLDI